MSRHEDNFQIQVVDFLTRNGIYARHIKNQGRWSVAYGAKLNRMGRRKGTADLECITQINEHLPRGIFMLECKHPPRMLPSGKRSRVIPRLDRDQQDVADTLAKLGIPTICVNTLEDAERLIRAFGVPLRGRVQ